MHGPARPWEEAGISDGLGPGKLKHARLNDFKVGWALVKPNGWEKKPIGPKEGPTKLNKAKGKAPTCQVDLLTSSITPRGDGVFLFSTGTLKEGE